MSKSPLNYRFEECKVCGANSSANYRLRCGKLHVCSKCTLHFLNYLDPVNDLDPEIQGDSLTNDLVAYLETQLQSSVTRFENHVKLVESFGALSGKRILDIGCGGGLFLAKARERGAIVKGIELDDGRAAYCQTKHQLDVVKRPIESDWWDAFQETFDVVTLWDVIEHVNFPLDTLRAASRLLKPGGIFLLDTPARDAFYHRVGELTYRLSFGKFPTFLNTMYSSHPFGHKQILSTREVAQLLKQSQLNVIKLEKIHELSFPYEFYLRRLLRSKALARLTSPLATAFFACFRIRNKMVVVARKLS